MLPNIGKWYFTLKTIFFNYFFIKIPPPLGGGIHEPYTQHIKKLIKSLYTFLFLLYLNLNKTTDLKYVPIVPVN